MKKSNKKKEKSLTPEKGTVRVYSTEMLLKLGKDKNKMDFAKKKEKKD